VLECLEFTRASDRGFCGSGGGTWSVTNCVFSRNSNSTTFVPGVAAYFTTGWFAKQTGAISVRLSGCTFSENFITNFADGASSGDKGGVLQLTQVIGAHLDRCMFVSNGIPFTTTGTATQNYRHLGTAVSLNSTPLVATGCKFIANRSSSFYYGNGCVVYAPAKNDNAGFHHHFTNCQFVANESVGYAGTSGYAGRAPIWMPNGTAASTAEVVNCTFAYNLDARYNCGGGVSMAGGYLKVKNCIFHGNSNTSDTCRYDLYRSGGGAVTDISYTMFDATNDVYAAEGVTNRFGLGVMTGDPRFVTRTETFGPLVVKGADNLPYLDWTKPEMIIGINVHLYGRYGYYDERTGLKTFGPSGRPSKAVDAGDPTSDFALEPKENPNPRINLGCYGGTPWATLSPLSGSRVVVR